MTIQHWIIDFDDTLGKSWDTWAMTVGFPRFIETHKLETDAEKLNQAIMEAQAVSASSHNADALYLLQGLFKTMGWSQQLASQFLQEVHANFQLDLFDDALPFLERLREQQKTVYIVSNNPLSTERVKQFGLLSYVEAVLTPDKLPGAPRKPDIAVWDALKTLYSDLSEKSTVVVGDDPWSEGTFADACGLPCWIVDRNRRYRQLYSTKPYQWVYSLKDIKLS
jgi:FMN phosphatase YigB (HAD superfamily)